MQQRTHTDTCKQLNRISKWRNAALNNSNCTKEVNLIKWDKGSKTKSITVNKVAATRSQNALMTVIVNVEFFDTLPEQQCQGNWNHKTKGSTKPFSSHFEPFSKSNYSNSIVPRTTVLFFLLSQDFNSILFWVSVGILVLCQSFESFEWNQSRQFVWYR